MIINTMDNITQSMDACVCVYANCEIYNTAVMPSVIELRSFQ